jgi:hypothetical protein
VALLGIPDHRRITKLHGINMRLGNKSTPPRNQPKPVRSGDIGYTFGPKGLINIAEIVIRLSTLSQRIRQEEWSSSTDSRNKTFLR